MTIEATPEGVRLNLHIQPGASRSEVAGRHGDAIRIRLMARPVDGQANAALLRFLAQQLGVRSHDIELLRGASSRTKEVLVRGMDVERARAALMPGEQP